MTITQKILGSVAAMSMFAATSAAMAQGYSPAYPPEAPVYSSAPNYAPPPQTVYPQASYPQAGRGMVPGGQPNFDQVDDNDAPPPVALSVPGQAGPNDPRYSGPSDQPVYSERPPANGPIYPGQDQRVARGYPGDQPDVPRPPEGVDSSPVGSTGGAPNSIYASLPPDVQPEVGTTELAPRLRRQEVSFATKEPAGTIIVDTPNTYLYFILGHGRAMRYGVRVGRDGFTWNGTQKITRKAEWPDWTPPPEMIERQPYLPRFMAGGDGNPLGARAMYLGSTVYRIHGTNQPSTIGTYASSGCIGLLNDDVIDLFNRTKVGTRVVVLPAAMPAALASAAPAQSASGQPLAPMGAPITVR